MAVAGRAPELATNRTGWSRGRDWVHAWCSARCETQISAVGGAWRCAAGCRSGDRGPSPRRVGPSPYPHTVELLSNPRRGYANAGARCRTRKVSRRSEAWTVEEVVRASLPSVLRGGRLRGRRRCAGPSRHSGWRRLPGSSGCRRGTTGLCRCPVRAARRWPCAGRGCRKHRLRRPA